MPSSASQADVDADGAATTNPPGGRDALQRWVLLVATVLMGLIAGFFYAYACSVMIGLADVDDRTFIATMQSINATVRNPAFAPSFFGSLVVTAAAAGLYARRRRDPVFRWTASALALYAVAFVITFAISVPLNDQLASAGRPDALTDVQAVRDTYEDPWVVWNIARTIAATAALVALARACQVHHIVRRQVG